jgi:hypothetical protein
MALGFFKKLLNKAKSYVIKTLSSAVNKGLEAAGKVINTVAPIANKAAGLLYVIPLGGIANTMAGGLNIAQVIVQKGRGFMQNLQQMLGNNEGGGE